MSNYKDDDFRFCDDCGCEHNHKGETREEYAARTKGAPTSKLDALKETLARARAALDGSPDSDPTYAVDAMAAASMSPVSREVKTAQIALTQAVTELCAGPGYRLTTGEAVKPTLGQHVAAMARVAVDALVSSQDGHLRPDSLKALLGALVDEASAFYAEHKDKMKEHLDERRESLKGTITSLEMMVGVLEAEQRRVEAEDIKSGAAAHRLASKATLVANMAADDAAKQREFDALLKALDGKNTRAH